MTVSQLLILNNLIYCKDFKQGTAEGKTVGDILQDMKKHPENYNNNAFMTTKEWEQVFNIADQDEEIRNLKVVSSNYEKDTDAGMACFADKDGNAYAVFCGTGRNEWRDDAVAGAQADSVQQKKALEWFDSLHDEYGYDHINVSGHSKGGNKAMYVTIRSDYAGECYAFDGEGFSNEFCDKYSEQINQKAQNIHLRANYRDFVHPLLICIAGDVKYIKNDGGIGKIYAEYHSPNALFNYVDGVPDGSIGPFTDREDPAVEFIHDFSNYLMDNVPPAEKIVVLSALGELLQFGFKGELRKDIIDSSAIQGFDTLFRYLVEYLKDLKRSDPKKYKEYNIAITRYANGFFEGGLPDAANFFMDRLLFDALEDGALREIWNIASADAVTGRGRDFSEETKEKMLRSAQETEEEQWWRVDRWDCWYKVEKFFGHLEWNRYTGKVDEYYRKLIDINDASRKDIEAIFNKVYSIDASCSQKIEGSNGQLDGILSRAKSLADSVFPQYTVHEQYSIPRQQWLEVSPKVTNDAEHRDPDSYDAVIASFDVEHNSRYTPGADTWCNIYVWDVTRAMGCEIPHYYNKYTGAPMTQAEALKNPGTYLEMSAPRMTAWLEKYGAQYGWTECDEATAIANANLGCPTVAAATNTGHVAMVAPQRGDETGVVISQAGGRNFEHGNLRNGFGNYNVKYFTHV